VEALHYQKEKDKDMFSFTGKSTEENGKISDTLNANED